MEIAVTRDIIDWDIYQYFIMSFVILGQFHFTRV